MTAQRAISRQSIPDAIADDLRERILSGEMAEGEPIRQEALAKEYDVSRMPVREALKRLDAEGLVQLTNNRGASVTSHSLEEISEIFDMRILLECDLFRRAIPNMTADHFARCEELLRNMDLSYTTDAVEKWGILNFEYHMALYDAAERKLTNEVLQGLYLQSDRYVRMHLSVLQQRAPASDEHKQLLELAKAGNPDAASDVLDRHIRRTGNELLGLIAEKRAATA